MTNKKYNAQALTGFATALLERTGMDLDKTEVVSEILVEGDLLGHNTHGLQLLAAYLADFEKGEMAVSDQSRVIADLPAAVAWDGMRLPGESSLRRRTKQFEHGVELYPEIMPDVEKWATRFGIALPEPLG